MFSILCIGCAVVIAGCSKETQPTVFRDGRVDYLEGDVRLDGTTAELNQQVASHSTVETRSASLADLIFNERNIVHIGENTLFNVNPDDVTGSTAVSRGTLLIVAKKLLQIDDSAGLTVKTPTAVLGVRGTSFFVHVENENSTYICICNGTIHTEDTEGEHAMELTSPHHRAVRYVRKNGSVSVEDAAMLYHSDTDVENVAAKIGVTIDWTKPD